MCTVNSNPIKLYLQMGQTLSGYEKVPTKKYYLEKCNKNIKNILNVPVEFLDNKFMGQIWDDSWNQISLKTFNALPTDVQEWYIDEYVIYHERIPRNLFLLDPKYRYITIKIINKFFNKNNKNFDGFSGPLMLYGFPSIYLNDKEFLDIIIDNIVKNDLKINFKLFYNIKLSSEQFNRLNVLLYTTNTDDLDGFTVTGKIFNTILKKLNIIPIKLTNSTEIHNRLQLKDGLNIDHIPFNPTGSCSKGGIYFCDLNKINLWLSYKDNRMVHYRFVIIPDDANVYIETNKYKADQLILGEREVLNYVLINGISSKFKTIMNHAD